MEIQQLHGGETVKMMPLEPMNRNDVLPGSTSLFGKAIILQLEYWTILLSLVRTLPGSPKSSTG